MKEPVLELMVILLNKFPFLYLFLIIMPPLLPLSSKAFERHGLYIIEDGQCIYLWVGKDAVPQLIWDILGLTMDGYGLLRSGKVCHCFRIILCHTGLVSRPLTLLSTIIIVG